MNLTSLKEYVKESHWWNRAKCAGMAPAFDGEFGTDIDPKLLRVCVDCPVRVLCAVDAVIHGDALTVRGGIRLTGRVRGERQLRTWLEHAHRIVLPEIQRTNPNLANGNAKGACTRWHAADCGCWKESA